MNKEQARMVYEKSSVETKAALESIYGSDLFKKGTKSEIKISLMKEKFSRCKQSTKIIKVTGLKLTHDFIDVVCKYISKHSKKNK